MALSSPRTMYIRKCCGRHANSYVCCVGFQPVRRSGRDRREPKRDPEIQISEESQRAHEKAPLVSTEQLTQVFKT